MSLRAARRFRRWPMVLVYDASPAGADIARLLQAAHSPSQVIDL
jgi:hypothetical protein